MSRKSRQGHREALLDAAKSLMRESGSANVTARDLVVASDTNLGSIGYHFGSKQALLDEAATAVFQEWAATVTKTLAREGDATPAEVLASSLRTILDDFEAMRPYFVGFIELASRSSRSTTIREQLAVHYGKQRAAVATMISESLGEDFAEDDAVALASVLMAISDGLMLQLMISADDGPSSEELVEASRRALRKVTAPAPEPAAGTDA
jgi:AcrR family transcriptional regulator